MSAFPEKKKKNMIPVLRPGAGMFLYTAVVLEREGGFGRMCQPGTETLVKNALLLFYSNFPPEKRRQTNTQQYGTPEAGLRGVGC